MSWIRISVGVIFCANVSKFEGRRALENVRKFLNEENDMVKDCLNENFQWKIVRIFPKNLKVNEKFNWKNL